MPAEDLKNRIDSCIKSFIDGNLTERALALFDTLGYITERQAPLEQKTFKALSDSYFDGQKFNEEKAFVKDWCYVDLLFQLSKNEILQQTDAFDTNRVDKTAIETYLFFAIELKGTHYTRTELAGITREVNRLFPMPAMILFKYDRKLTLSVIDRRINNKHEDKDVLKKVTLIKDISIDRPLRAHIEILFDLSMSELLRVHKFTNFVQLHQAWQKTLDIKELNKKFFQELSNWYFAAMNEVSFPDDLEKKKEVRNATNLIRLITRVIFIWFIKEKQLVPASLFRKDFVAGILKDFNKTKKSQSYYNAILQNLFFGTLNQKMGDRKFAKEGDLRTNKEEYGVKNLYRYADLFIISEKEVLGLFKDVPFLNGGLFDCLDKPNDDGKIEYVDGFSRNDKKQAFVPDYIFFGEEKEVDLNDVYGTKNKHYSSRGLINLLESYKFTVAENTPIEEEIALDPELLGKVFENLLASYNPETQTTARKQTGSFYTPREIVNYMVDESLLEYIKQNVKNDSKDFENRLRDMLSYSENMNPFSEAETKNLIEAINNCKILDPACGSGAYPMGVLHKMVHLLQKLDPENKHWKALQRQKAMEETESAFRIGDKEERGKRLAEINDVFENNASDYGRKLYLIENCIYGIDIQPIAVQISKLRFFISLIIDQEKQATKENFGIRSLPNLETKFVAANTLIGLDKPVETTADIFMVEANDQFFKLKTELKEVRHKYFSANNRKDKLGFQKADKKIRDKISMLLVKQGWKTNVAKQVVAFDPYDQNKSSGWFEPEWMFGLTTGFDIVIGNPPYGAKFTDKEKKYFKAILKHQDYQPESFLFFTEKCFDFLKIHAILSFIIPNTWLTNLKLVKIRKFLTSSNTILNISHYHKSVFDAVVDTEVVIFKKGYLSENQVKVWRHLNKEQVLELNHLQDKWKEKKGDVINIFSNDTIENLISKLKINSQELSFYADAYSGVKPYEIGKGTPPQTKKCVEDRIYDSLKKLDNSYKKILRGKDIDRYENNWDGKRWIKYGENLAAPRKPRIFTNPKVIVRQTGDSLIATYDEDEFICMNNTHVINKKNIAELKFLLALINSKLLTFYFQYLNPETGEALAEVKKENLEKLLIKLPVDQKPFINIVDQILIEKKCNPKMQTTVLERNIDELVFKLYDLKYDEVKIIAPDFWLSEEEYNKLDSVLKNTK